MKMSSASRIRASGVRLAKKALSGSGMGLFRARAASHASDAERLADSRDVVHPEHASAAFGGKQACGDGASEAFVGDGAVHGGNERFSAGTDDDGYALSRELAEPSQELERLSRIFREAD